MTISEGLHNLNKLRFKRKLRHAMTEAEKVLWKELRAKRFQGTKWRRQSNIGNFIADFRCAEHRLIIEVDGKIHEDRKEYDEARTAVIQDYGYRVIRFTNEEVLENLPMVLEKIEKALKEPSPPSPSPHCGEGVVERERDRGSGLLGPGGEASRRSAEIDVLRVIAIFLMIIYHIAFDLTFFYGYSIPVTVGFWKLLEVFCASLFLVLVGMSFALSSQREVKTLKYFKRGFQVFCYGLVVTVVTFYYDPETYIRFGILHLIGVSLFLLPFFARFKKWNASIGLLLLFPFVAFGHPDGPWYLLPFGFMPEVFRSTDYFPLYPWFGVILIGVAAGHVYIEHRTKLTFIPNDSTFGKVMTAISKRSLLIYMVHQPLILLALHLALGG